MRLSNIPLHFAIKILTQYPMTSFFSFSHHDSKPLIFNYIENFNWFCVFFLPLVLSSGVVRINWTFNERFMDHVRFSETKFIQRDQHIQSHYNNKNLHRLKRKQRKTKVKLHIPYTHTHKQTMRIQWRKWRRRKAKCLN